MSEMTTREFIEGFVKGTLGKKNRCGRWSIVPIDDGKMEALRYSPEDVDEHEDIAYRLPDKTVLANANVLHYVGRRNVWGSKRDPRGQGDEQRWLENAGAIALPFTLFTEAKMNIGDFSWVVKPEAETLTTRRRGWHQGSKQSKFEQRHFSGACIFAIGSDMYLFDVDRQEVLENNIFNPFLVKLPERVESIEAAYDVLMPEEVREAAYSGKEVRRQGEFFFIKYSNECPVSIDLTLDEKMILRFVPSRFGFGVAPTRDRYHDDEPLFLQSRTRGVISFRSPSEIEFDENNLNHVAFQDAAMGYKAVVEKAANIRPKPGTIGKANSGSHNVDKFVKVGDITFVSGKIVQQRREHGEQTLDGWWKVVPNAAVFSWTITGQVD